MAVDSNAVDITQLTSESTIPALYDERMIKALYDNEVIRPLAMDKSDMLSGAGHTFNVYTRSRFSVPTSALSDGATIAITGVTHSATAVTINYYGDAHQMTDQSLDQGFDFVFRDWSEDAVAAMGELRDYIGMAVLVAQAGSTLYPFKSDGSFYTSSDVDADAKLQYEQILRIRDKMRKARHKMAYAVIDTRQESQLLEDSRFTSMDYVTNPAVPNGTVARGLGCNFIVSNAVTTSTENSLTVANAIFLSDKKDAFVYAEKVAPRFRFGRAAANELFQTWAYYLAFGFKVVDSNGVVIGKSVVPSLS